MADQSREDELARTARIRGAEPQEPDEVIAMREAEAAQGTAPESVGSTVSRSVLKRLEIQGAIPQLAPDDVRLRMAERMRRWRAEVERFVDGESSLRRAERLDLLWKELYPEQPYGCACGGSGLIERTGRYQARSGRVTEGTFMAICDCRFGDERRVHARGEIYGMEDSKDDPF